MEREAEFKFCINDPASELGKFRKRTFYVAGRGTARVKKRNTEGVKTKIKLINS